MSTLIVTITLILVALASTMVSVFWSETLRQKLALLGLAVCSSVGAIYVAYEMERRASITIHAQEEIILSMGSVPYGFEDVLQQAVDQVAERKKYSRAILTTTAPDWSSEYFGYGISFIEPLDEKPLTGYEDLWTHSGCPHSFAFLPRSSVSELIRRFVNGIDLTAGLEEQVLWVWKTADVKDERFLQSIRGLAYQAYMAAAHSEYDHEFQRQPEKYWIDLDISQDKFITVLATTRKPEANLRRNAYVLGSLSPSFLDELVGVDALTRNSKVFYRLYGELLSDWYDPQYMPIISGR